MALRGKRYKGPGTAGICREDTWRSLFPVTRLAPPRVEAAGIVAGTGGWAVVAGETACGGCVWLGLAAGALYKAWRPGTLRAQGPHNKPSLHTWEPGKRGGDAFCVKPREGMERGPSLLRG